MATLDSDGFFVSEGKDTMNPLSSYLNAIIANLKAKIKDQTPTGTVTAFAGTTAPAGWYMCDGSICSQENDPKLFEVIGTVYGQGTGSSGSFNLPDLSARFPVGAKMNPSGDVFYNYDLGKTSGQERVQLTIDEMPKHIHRQEYGYSSRGVPSRAGKSIVRTAVKITTQAERNAGLGFERKNSVGLYVYPSGKDRPHTNMPPYLALNYIIKR